MLTPSTISSILGILSFLLSITSTAYKIYTERRDLKQKKEVDDLERQLKVIKLKKELEQEKSK